MKAGVGMSPIMAILLSPRFLCEPPAPTEPRRNLRSEAIAEVAGLDVGTMDALTSRVADYFASR